MKTGEAVAVVAVLAVAFAVAGPAQASGLRVEGTNIVTKDGSFDAMSSNDHRRVLDASFSWSVLCLARMFTLDVEAGYLRFLEHDDTLYGTYGTSLEGHSVYGGLRLQMRWARARYLNFVQPFVRVDFGWSWTKGEISPLSGNQPTMYDWDSSPFVYVGGGIQLMVPAEFVREKMRIRVSKWFSIGVSYEIGWYQPGPVKFSMRQDAAAENGVEPIPVDGFGAGSLDLAGFVHRFGVVVAF